MRDDREKLLDIFEAIEQIEKYAVQGREAFESNELIQIWHVRHLQVIGEAARTLSSTFKDRHPQISWTRIIGMRNILVHHYFEIDLPVVWEVVENELPPLKEQVEAILRQEGGGW
ncbi:MAG: DUF86 domain-containing protein [Syntrophobacterales bacterium]|jgi:uncharacterized protein with HEPN domain|nr:DUF86 domain-containing protein [Syntrophobacterales bacterium]